MTWTTLADVSQDLPILATWGNSVRDNFAALANGDPGAPRVQNAAMAENSVDSRVIATLGVVGGNIANSTINGNEKIINGSVWGDDKLQDSSVAWPKMRSPLPGESVTMRIKEGITNYPAANAGDNFYEDPLDYFAPRNRSRSFNCIRSGSVNFYIVSRRVNSNLFLRILVNGTVNWEVQVTNSNFEVRSVNIGFNFGDQVTIQWRASELITGGYDVAEIYLRTNNQGIGLV